MENIHIIKAESLKLKKEVRKQTAGYIMTALGLVAGLAWNEAITAFIQAFFPAKDSLIAKFVYAILITLVIVVLITYLNKYLNREEN